MKLTFEQCITLTENGLRGPAKYSAGQFYYDARGRLLMVCDEFTDDAKASIDHAFRTYRPPISYRGIKACYLCGGLITANLMSDREMLEGWTWCPTFDEMLNRVRFIFMADKALSKYGGFNLIGCNIDFNIPISSHGKIEVHYNEGCGEGEWHEVVRGLDVRGFCNSVEDGIFFVLLSLLKANRRLDTQGSTKSD